MKIKYLILILLTINLGCEKELTQGEKDRLVAANKLETTRFKCNGGNSDYFFRGTINKDSICYYDNTENYLMYNGLGTSTISGNTLSVGSNSNNTGTYFLNLSFNQIYNRDSNFTTIDIIAPHIKPSKTPIDVKTFVDSFLKEGFLPILDNKSSELEKFKIVVNILHAKNNGHLSIDLTTSLGSQATSYLKCTQIEEKKEFGKTYYDLAFDLSCNLYCYNYSSKNYTDILLYGRLKGVFKTKLFL
jgi:hypothetical protein